MDHLILATDILNLESSLKNTKIMFLDKVNELFYVFEQVSNIIILRFSEKDIDKLLDMIYRLTMAIVLQDEWLELLPAKKDDFMTLLQKCGRLFSSQYAVPKFKLLVKLVNDPWSHPIVKQIADDQEISDKEVLNFCLSEMGIGLATRLEKLCAGNCEDITLRLLDVIVRCLQLKGPLLREHSTEDHILYMVEVSVSLLYKYNRKKYITTCLKCLEIKDGLKLIQRYSKNKREDIAELMTQILLTLAMIKPVECTNVLKDLISKWLIQQTNNPAFLATMPMMVLKFIHHAASAIHFYTFCEVIINMFEGGLRPLCIELFIRGLTTDMNELEQQKAEENKEKVKEVEIRLSDNFLRLADLVKDDVGVCRECVLTAFSLNPTVPCLEMIKELADASRILYTASEKNQRTLDALISIRGNTVTESLNYDVLSAPNKVLDADALGLSPDLCMDLAVVLSSPRNQMLSWVQNWKELYESCEKYLKNFKVNRITTKELKFVKINYNLYKTLPIDMDHCSGIEKGYEHFANERKCRFSSIKKHHRNRKPKSNTSGFQKDSNRVLYSSKSNCTSESSKVIRSSFSPYMLLTCSDNSSQVLENHCQQSANKSDHICDITRGVICEKSDCNKNNDFNTNYNHQLPSPHQFISDITQTFNVESDTQWEIDCELNKYDPPLDFLKISWPPLVEPSIEEVEFSQALPTTSSISSNRQETSDQSVQSSNLLSQNFECANATSTSNHYEASQLVQSSHSRTEVNAQPFLILKSPSPSTSTQDVNYLTEINNVNDFTFIKREDTLPVPHYLLNQTQGANNVQVKVNSTRLHIVNHLRRNNGSENQVNKAVTKSTPRRSKRLGSTPRQLLGKKICLCCCKADESKK